MDVERLLISKIVAEGNLSAVNNAGIDLAYFDDPMNRQLFRSVRAYASQYGKVPTRDALRRDHPSVKLPDAEDYPISYLIDELRDNRERALLSDGILETTEFLQMGETKLAWDVMTRTLRRRIEEVPTAVSLDVTHETLERRAKAYEEIRKRDGRLLGIPSGFESIDLVTQGFQPGQLVTFVGLPKAGKSTLMLLAAMAAHGFAFRPYFQGFEMSIDEQEHRHEAILGRVSHHRLRTGTLKPDEYRRLKKAWRGLENMPEFFFSTDANSATTLSGLQTQVERHEPDIVFVDGVYMMRDEEGEAQGSPQAITNITRGFKRLAVNFNIPFVISTQALAWKTDKRRGLTETSIGYSSSFGQDSDIVIGVEKTELSDVNKLKVLLARNAPVLEKHIRWDWDTGIFEELDYNPFAKPKQDSTDAQSGF